MIKAQALNKIIADKDIDTFLRANIDESYFSGYKDEYAFILSHYKKYGNVPDIETFLQRFSDFEVVEVHEGTPFLIDALREEKEFADLMPILQDVATIAETNATLAKERAKQLINALPQIARDVGTDIIQNAHHRFDEYQKKQESQTDWYFSSGFPELDILTGGIQRTEELILIFARTNQGKSWIAEKMATTVWEQGYNVGFFSPEMTANSVGYRFDTLFAHFSNYHLVHGTKNHPHETKYAEYIKTLPTSKKASFIVATPSDFDRKPTVSRLRNWIKDMNLSLVVIDGISYLHDERQKRGDNTTTSLTNIAEDLMSLSIELNVPIIIVAQANREAAGEDKTSAPTLETVRNSDGLAHNASKVFSMRNKKNQLELSIEKQRTGPVGNKLLYNWDIDTGMFTYIPSDKAGLPKDVMNEALDKVKDEYKKDVCEVF